MTICAFAGGIKALREKVLRCGVEVSEARKDNDEMLVDCAVETGKIFLVEILGVARVGREDDAGAEGAAGKGLDAEGVGRSLSDGSGSRHCEKTADVSMGLQEVEEARLYMYSSLSTISN